MSWHYSVNAAEQHWKVYDLIDSNADRKECCYSKHERTGLF